jgi:Metallopeptidase toxin 4/MafB19-like deaminase
MSKLLNDKDFFMCTGGLAPAQMQTIQRVSKKKDGTLYLLKTDTATSSIIDFSCKKMMILMAIIAVVVCALVIATGGMALIAAAAIGGAIGAVAGALICGQKGAAARTWIGYKNDLKILGTETLTDSAFMKCMLFQEEIRIAPHIKNWWQAAAVGLTNFAGEMFKCVMIGAAAAGVVVLATEGIGAFFVNAASNYLMTWTTGWGLGLRGAMGVMDGVNQKYVNGTSTEDALSSGLGNAAFGMEKGTANSAYNVSTGQGTAEDYVGLLAWGAPVPKGNGEAKGPGPEADHMGSSPWEGKPQRGSTGFKESPRMSRSEVQAYKKAMNEQGINVEVDKAGRLPENTRAAFDNQTGTVYLRKGATQYEAFHEQQHAQQWKEMGKEAYNKQSRVQKEQHVYDQVMKNKDKFSQAELDHARDYMNDVRKAAGMEPMPLDKMETKGQDGDLFEDPATVASKPSSEVQKGFDDLAAKRRQLGLPEAGSPSDAATLAKLVIDGQTFEGVNSKLQNPRSKITLKANAQTKTHAEAEVIQKAIDAGKKGTAKEAEMWTDRDACDACGKYNGIGSLARELGVEKIIVHSPGGTNIYYPPGIK